jgi:hypothetical protein
MAFPNPRELTERAYYSSDDVYEIMIDAARSGKKEASVLTARLSEEMVKELREQGYGVKQSAAVSSCTYISW